MQSADSQNTTLVRGDAAEAILKLKQLIGKDLVIFGSGKLVSSLAPISLIDEYRIIVNPIVLGSGNPLFSGLKDRLHLELVNSRVFRNGNVLLCYQPGGEK